MIATAVPGVPHAGIWTLVCGRGKIVMGFKGLAVEELDKNAPHR